MCNAITAAGSRRLGRILLVGVLLVSLAMHVGGVCLDLAAAIRYPFELDYGEGIVWQQAVLVPGPRMYGTSPELPFIVFHYPPIYYLFARAALFVAPDLLAAGRLVSALSTLLIAPAVAGLALLATRRPGAFEAAIAVSAGMLVLCLHPVHVWGMMMRVDMLAIAFGLAGLLIAAWSNWRFPMIAVALLLCAAAVFTKQTQLSAGIAVFLIGLLRNPRGTLGAAATAGTAGLGALWLLQSLTGGGFLQNIIGYNINRFSLFQGFFQFRAEQGPIPYMLMMLLAVPVLVGSIAPSALQLRLRSAWRELWVLRSADRTTTCRALLLLHFALATLMLSTTFKSGSSINYLLEWLITGCVLIAVLLLHLARSKRFSKWAFPAAVLVVALTLGKHPLRVIGNWPPGDLEQQAALVQQIAAAGKPVASENMTLLMRAGKPVIYEPAIVTELAALNRWDEARLLGMIRQLGFAFMITTDNEVGGSTRRSQAVDAAMRDAYSRVEQVGPMLWMHLPTDAPRASAAS
jgi:hypothetical protein